jgi:ribosomal protein L7/L12
MAIKLSRENWKLLENRNHHGDLVEWFIEALDEADINVDEVLDQFRAQVQLEGRELITDVDREVIETYGTRRNFINAIKRHRELTGQSLRESKEYVEKLIADRGL